MRLKDKVAVVTGGGSGIGEAICVRLSEEGARVAVVDLDLDAAKLTATLVGGISLRADVSDSGAIDRTLADTEKQLGPVDIWVNNAGIGDVPLGDHMAPRIEQQLAEAAQSGRISTPLDALQRIDDESWRRMLAVHLDGTFYGTRAAARSMVARGQGSIVNIASICGIEGCTGFSHYSAAKAGILGFTRSVAKELIVQGVRVNAVAPGYIDTPLLSEGMNDTLQTMLQLQTPIGRLGRPDEIAATVAFLASDDASFFVGETVSPNGGYVTT
jgi:3-oxoacyl-[acyl-carrier protein] reductase